MRTKGAAIATGMNWICNFLVVEITPYGVRNIGWRFYIIWTVFNASFLPLIWLVYPETADRTLEDLDAYYRDDPPLLVFRDKNSTSRKRPAKYAEMQRADIETAAAELRKRAVVSEEAAEEHLEEVAPAPVESSPGGVVAGGDEKKDT